MQRMLGLMASLAFALVLTACSSSSSNPSQPAAVIELSAPSQAEELETNRVAMALSGPIDVALDGSSSRLADNYQWQLVQIPEGSTASIETSDQANAGFTADLEGDYLVSLTINADTDNAHTSHFTFVGASTKPVATTDAEINVASGTSNVGLDGSQSKMAPGIEGELQYSWSLVSSPDLSTAAQLLNANSARPTLELDVIGEYQLEFFVFFGDQKSATQDVTINVFQGNVQPVAKAANQTSIMGQQVQLDASASSDAEGSALQYRWRLVDGPLNELPTLNNPNSDKPDFTPSVAGEYEFKLFVFDGQRASEEVDVVVNVAADPLATQNLAPVGELVATGYYPSKSFGEQEKGLRAEFNFIGYDPEGKGLSIVSAELIEKPAASEAELVNIGSWKPLGRKIQVLDEVGTYRVRMTVTDGEQETTVEATMVAKIGLVNNYPTTNLGVDSTAVLTGNALIFEASVRDQDGDEVVYEWSLIDKPNGSNATVEPVINPENGELSRAHVVTDIAGVYRVKLRVKDSRGLYDPNPEEEFGYAKDSNQAPVIESVVWKRNWGGLAPGENYYQILPCMSLLHRPVVVDPDGDEVFTLNELNSAPEDGKFTSWNYDTECPNTRGTVFTKAGQYIFRYDASDVIDRAPSYDFIVNVDSMDDARGVLLRNVSSSGDLLHPLPYENIPSYGYVSSPTSSPITQEQAFAWSLEAMDGNYTVENVSVKHINGNVPSLIPRFAGLEEGTVINQGTTLNFETVLPAVPCLRTDDKKEGFEFSFNIKEIPEISFTFVRWVGDSGFLSDWQACDAGQLD